MDPVSSQAGTAAFSHTTGAESRAVALYEPTPHQTATIAVPEPRNGHSETLQRVLSNMQALTPAADRATGKITPGNLDQSSTASKLVDIEKMPPELKQALATFRNVALEALVPGVAVNVTMGAAGSLKRIQQGQ